MTGSLKRRPADELIVLGVTPDRTRAKPAALTSCHHQV